MKIETKLDIGDIAFIMSNNKVKEVEVEEIDIRIKTNHLGVIEKIIRYTLTHAAGDLNFFNESEIYSTKQDLLNDL